MIAALAANPNYQSSRFQKATFQEQVRRRDAHGRSRPGTRPIGVLPSMVGMLALAGHRFATAERLKPPLYGIALTTSEGTRFVYVSTWISSNTTWALEQLDEVREGSSISGRLPLCSRLELTPSYAETGSPSGFYDTAWEPFTTRQGLSSTHTRPHAPLWCG